jgi:endo-1,4-beta-D-glucanase Y
VATKITLRRPLAATEGDIDAVYALLLASHEWKRPKLYGRGQEDIEEVKMEKLSLA